MNPVKLLRIATRANKLLSLFQRASDDWDTRKRKGESMSKSLFASKTFWFNALSAVVELTQILPLPVGTVAAIAAVANVGLRLISNQPVHIVAPSK